MTAPADFRQYALDCMREAESADDAAMRLTMVGMARIWMDMALELDKHVMRANKDDARSFNNFPIRGAGQTECNSRKR